MSIEIRKPTERRHRIPLNEKGGFDRIRSVWVKSFFAILIAGGVIIAAEILGSAWGRVIGFILLGFFAITFISAYVLGILQFPKASEDAVANSDSTPHEPPLIGLSKK